MFLRTAPQSCLFQDLLLAARHYCDHFPRKTLTEIDATFTFNADGYTIFDQNNWATYMAAMKEDKPPPGSNRHTQKSGLITGAAYSAEKTDRFGQASRAIADQQAFWTGPTITFLTDSDLFNCTIFLEHWHK